MCAKDFTPDDGWIPVAIPPNSMRLVHLKFADDTEYQGFYVYMEGRWYLKDGSKAKKNSVHPTYWAEGETLRELLSRLVSDEDIGLMA
jgi:hypothetical protein